MIRSSLTSAAIVAILIAAAGGLAHAETPNGEGKCMVLTKVGAKSVPSSWSTDIRVLNGPDQLTVSVAPGSTLQGIGCERASTIPDVRDDRVVRQFPGATFYIFTNRNLGALSLDGDKVIYTLIDGAKWTPGEEAKIIERLNLYALHAHSK